MKANRENIHNWRPRMLLNTRSRNCCVFEKFRVRFKEGDKGVKN